MRLLILWNWCSLNKIKSILKINTIIKLEHMFPSFSHEYEEVASDSQAIHI